jgi:hypothetical protein
MSAGSPLLMALPLQDVSRLYVIPAQKWQGRVFFAGIIWLFLLLPHQGIVVGGLPYPSNEPKSIT